MDALLDQEADLFCGIHVLRYKGRFGFGHLTAEDSNQVRTALQAEVLPRHLALLEQQLQQSTTGWLANTVHPSIADFVLAVRLKWLDDGDGVDGIRGIFHASPRLAQHQKAFYDLPAIKAYYEKQNMSQK